MNTEKEISPSQTAQIIEHLIKASTVQMVNQWNEANPEDPIDFRYLKSKVDVKNHPDIKAQACLSLEVKTKLQWNVLNRKVVNFQSKQGLEKSEGLYELELWSAMFVEILNMGLLSAISIVQFRSDIKQQTNDHSKQEYPLCPDQAIGKAHSAKAKSPRKTNTKRN